MDLAHPLFPITGLCKHLHIARNVAASRNINWEAAQATLANDLFELGHYTYDGSTVCVFDGDNVYIVTSDNRCTCVASSHKVKCICQQVASLVKNSVAHSSCDTPAIPNSAMSDEPASPPSQSEPHSKRYTVKQQLQELLAWVDSDQFEAVNKTRQGEIIQKISAAHALAHNQKFRKITRKRKIEPNCSYRRSMERAKKLKRDNEHQYALKAGSTKTAKSKTKPDGSFKKTSRSKCQRKHFL